MPRIGSFGPSIRINYELEYNHLLYGKANLSALIGSFLVGISPYGPFPWKRSYAVYFLFSKAGKFKTSMARVPYNKLLNNLANSSRTGEYWPSVVFVQNSLRSVRTATTSGQYSPVRPSRSVSKRLVIRVAVNKHVFGETKFTYLRVASPCSQYIVAENSKLGRTKDKESSYLWKQ